jgi:hypothetical protein
VVGGETRAARRGVAVQIISYAVTRDQSFKPIA